MCARARVCVRATTIERVTTENKSTHSCTQTEASANEGIFFLHNLLQLNWFMRFIQCVQWVRVSAAVSERMKKPQCPCSFVDGGSCCL